MAAWARILKLPTAEEKKKAHLPSIKIQGKSFLSAAGCLKTGHMFISTDINCFHFPSTSAWVNYFDSKLFFVCYIQNIHTEPSSPLDTHLSLIVMVSAGYAPF